MPVNTAKVQGRRQLDYKSFKELLADADRMKSASVKTLGNWSAGQIYRHLATTFNGSIDGFTFTFPWYFRLVARIFKNRLLRSPMPSGFQMRSDAARIMVPGPTSSKDGLADLHAAVGRLEREPNRVKHPLFGNISKEEWDQLHLKHASMHMSFLVPQ